MNSTAVQAALLAASLAAVVVSGIRWLRVAQREHYLPGSVTLFARRWWLLGPNRLLGAAAVIGLVASAFRLTAAGLVAAVALAVGPFGLTLRGRTAKLAWTRRLRTLAAVTAAIVTVLVGLSALASGLYLAAAMATLLAVLTPSLVDAGLVLTAPLERRLGRPFVEQAKAKLKTVRPTVVAITGSYGKTSTKGYVAHLLTGSMSVVPSPRSYNNQAGLAKAINDNLTPGTEVFIAEMGTYGPGEIAEMCSWVHPDIAVITAIGPVHLERMKTEKGIAEAKAEILEGARVAVLNTDHPLLSDVADRAAAAGQKVRRCSAVDRRSDVCVVNDAGTLRVFIRADGTLTREIARANDLDAPPTNVACAVAVALELGVSPEAIAKRLPGLPSAPNRRQLITHRSGATVIDDTYNANPAGAQAALQLLDHLAVDSHRRVVVTPGMVELGERQAEENERFAADAAGVATDLVMVGLSNSAALMAGAREGKARVVRVQNREQAVNWVSEQVGPGDVVLYENDLPDHFP
jgi:UDP-N-acetylmuramoyl-tripeptide--D-alanyl-D-alanine ligase